jgi:membrane protease YdiL (CAAX protease family)
VADPAAPADASSPPRGRRLPIRALIGDVLCYFALLLTLSIGAVLVVRYTDGSWDTSPRIPPEAFGPQVLSMRFIACAVFDDGALLRELTRQGEVRPYISPLDGYTVPEPPVRIWPPLRLPGRNGAPDRVLRGGLVSVVIDPPAGEIVVIDVDGLTRAAGCAPEDIRTWPERIVDVASLQAATRQDLLTRSVPLLLLATLLATLLTSWLRGRRLPALSALHPLPTALLIAVLAGVAIQIGAITALAALLALGLEIVPANAELLGELAVVAPALGLAFVCVLAPWAEELFFRHLLLRRFALAGRPRWGLVCSATLFALMHELTPATGDVAAKLAMLLIYLLMGWALGLVYLRTGRLSAAVVAHGVANALATIAAWTFAAR